MPVSRDPGRIEAIVGEARQPVEGNDSALACATEAGRRKRSPPLSPRLRAAELCKLWLRAKPLRKAQMEARACEPLGRGHADQDSACLRTVSAAASRCASLGFVTPTARRRGNDCKRAVHPRPTNRSVQHPRHIAANRRAWASQRRMMPSAWPSPNLSL